MHASYYGFWDGFSDDFEQSDNVSYQKQKLSPKDDRSVSLVVQKRSCSYISCGLIHTLGAHPFLGLIGAIIRSWNLRSGPFIRASNYPWAQCARWLISSVVAPATWLARFIRVLFLVLSPPRGLPFSLPRYPLTFFFFSLRTSRSGPVQSRARTASTRGLTQPFHLIYSKPLFALPPGPDLKLVSTVEKKWSYETGERSIVLWSLPRVKSYLDEDRYCAAYRQKSLSSHRIYSMRSVSKWFHSYTS